MMSWQKCETDNYCCLAVPNCVVITLTLLHGWAAIFSLCLELPDELIAVTLLVIGRSLGRFLRLVVWGAEHALVMDGDMLVIIDEYRRTNGLRDHVNDRLRTHATYPGHADAMNEVIELNLTLPTGCGDPAGTGQQYTCCRRVKFPGCIALTLIAGSAKPLEILVFYRYDQRQFYRRLQRQIVSG